MVGGRGCTQRFRDSVNRESCRVQGEEFVRWPGVGGVNKQGDAQQGS